jgi:23S rRNA pseudouridine1911/1915/1917 synthase
LLVVNKPAGLPTQGALPDVPSLHTMGCDYLRRKYQKPGNVYLGIVMRLDACTSGVVVLARTSKAAARLSSQFRERETHKVYWAVVEGVPEAEQGEYMDWVAKDERQQRMKVVRCDGPAAQLARLQYRVLHRLSGGRTLLAVTLDTGRRLQMATRGSPILGDSKYGSHASFAPPGIALHAARLHVRHPVKQDELEFQAPLPSTWDALGIPEALRNTLRRAES